MWVCERKTRTVFFASLSEKLISPKTSDMGRKYGLEIQKSLEKFNEALTKQKQCAWFSIISVLKTNLSVFCSQQQRSSSNHHLHLPVLLFLKDVRLSFNHILAEDLKIKIKFENRPLFSWILQARLQAQSFRRDTGRSWSSWICVFGKTSVWNGLRSLQITFRIKWSVSCPTERKWSSSCRSFEVSLSVCLSSAS